MNYYMKLAAWWPHYLPCNVSNAKELYLRGRTQLDRLIQTVHLVVSDGRGSSRLFGPRPDG
jgi:hypothetical protein